MVGRSPWINWVGFTRNYKCSYMREAKWDVTQGRRSCDCWSKIIGMDDCEDRGRGYKSRNPALEAGKKMNGFSLKSSRGNAAQPISWFQISDSERVNMCCVKPQTFGNLLQKP